MMERMLMEYLANSVWQVPALALGAWLVLRAGRLGPRAQHGVWLGVLALAVLMPLHGMGRGQNSGLRVPVMMAAQPGGTWDSTAAKTAPDGTDTDDAGATWVEGQGASAGLAPRVTGPRWHWPSQAPHVHMVPLSPRATHVVAGLYFAIVLLAAFRLVRGWRAAARAVAQATPAELSHEESALLEACCERWQIAQPEVLVSTKVSGPVVVGVRRPVLLLPESFAGAEGAEARSGQELAAVWWHELAHVRRRDYLANLLCRVAALPVAYHPATYWIERRVRQTREMVCDAMAATEMDSSVGYARCLVTLAQEMLHGRAMDEVGLSTGLFSDNILEERVKELIGKKSGVSRRGQALRLAIGVAAMLAAIAAIAAFHVTPTLAKAVAVPAPALPASAPIAVLPVEQAVAPLAMAQPRAATQPAPAAQGVEPAQVAAWKGRPMVRTTTQITVRPVGPLPSEVELLPPVRLRTSISPQPLVPAKKQTGDMAMAQRAGDIVRLQKGTLPAQIAWAFRPLLPGQATPVAPAQTAPAQTAPAPQPAPKVTQPDANDGHAHVRVYRSYGEDLTPEERAKIAKAIADARQRIQDEMNSPEFKKSLEDAKKAAADAVKQMRDPAYQEQITEARQRALAALRQFNSQELQKQMEITRQQVEEMRKTFDSPEFKKQVEDAKNVANQFNTPEFRRQMEEAQREAMNATRDILNGDFRRQLEDMREQIEDASEAARDARREKLDKQREQRDQQRELDREKAEKDKEKIKDKAKDSPEN